MDLDIGIAFVILEAYVVLRTVFLDQVHLKDEGFQFGPHHDPFQVFDLCDEFAGLVVHFRALLEIRAHAIFQVNGLANVDHGSVAVTHDIAAWFGGQRGKDALDVFSYFHH